MTVYPTKNQPFESHREHLLNSFAAHKSNYWVGFISDPLTAMFFIFWDTAILRSNVFFLIVCYCAGLFSWSLFEYTFHRWIYHRGRTLAHAGHKMHHDAPKTLIGMPWFVTTGFLWCVWYVVGYRLQFRFGLGFMAGLVTGFISYSAFHHIHHHFNIKNSWYRKLGAHHRIHHRFSDVNFGVTNRFWDRIFGTTYRDKCKKTGTLRELRNINCESKSYPSRHNLINVLFAVVDVVRKDQNSSV